MSHERCLNGCRLDRRRRSHTAGRIRARAGRPRPLPRHASGDRHVIDEDHTEQAVVTARRVAHPAAEALQLAQRDIDSSRPQDPGQWGGQGWGGGRRGGGSSDVMGGILGGLVIGSILDGIRLTAQPCPRPRPHSAEGTAASGSEFELSAALAPDFVGFGQESVFTPLLELGAQ